MIYLKFTKNEKVNFKLIDQQHKEFINLVNKLYNASLKNDSNAINFLINELINFLKQHFETEEKLMLETKYQGYYSHKLEHERYIKKLKNIALKSSRNEITINNEFFESVKNWFLNHFELNDKKLGAYLVKMGVK